MVSGDDMGAVKLRVAIQSLSEGIADCRASNVPLPNYCLVCEKYGQLVATMAMWELKKRGEL